MRREDNMPARKKKNLRTTEKVPERQELAYMHTEEKKQDKKKKKQGRVK